jgi:tetratricopeptide (TPR) repeat protein
MIDRVWATSRPRQAHRRLGWAMAFIVLTGCYGAEPGATDANKKYIEATGYLAKGENDKAMEALNASLAAGPTLWAYRARARLSAESNNDAAALKDCEEALKVTPDDPDILWIKGELAKPAAERFKGRFKTPPSSNR